MSNHSQEMPPQWLDQAKLAANQAAEVLRIFDPTINSSSGRDIKTKADLNAETAIINCLASSQIPILSEETEFESEIEGQYHWVVDPLDGTMNYNRQFPIYATSIALLRDRVPFLGVIVDLNSGALYESICGLSADAGPLLHTQKNGSDCRVSGTDTINQAVIATGFPVKRDYSTEALHHFVEQIGQFKKVRMIGSAALSLAFVASGAFDVYFEEDIMLWDVAAGLSMVKAAGGAFEMRPGNGPQQFHVAATNGLIPPSDVLDLAL